MGNVVLAKKSVKQSYGPSHIVLQLMDSFRQMTNECIRIGLLGDISTLKRLSLLCYRELKRYEDVPGAYKLCAISKAVGILSSRKKSLRRGYPTGDSCVSKPVLISCYGLKIENGHLVIPIGNGIKEFVPLNNHTPRRGWVRFAQSKGEAGEAVKGNAEHEGEPLILRVDASKPMNRQQSRT